MIKKLLLNISILVMSINTFAQSTQNFHSFNAVTIAGDTISLSQFAGKKLMIVNTASYCGYTPQFTQLQQLYSQFHISNNFEILGFPCNDFGNQDPYGDSAAFNFCTSNYNVTFQMMSHVNIVSSDTTNIYKWLQLQSQNGVANAPVTWNFHKFLIDEAGNWVNHYPSQILPNDASIVNWILSSNITNVQDKKNEIFTFSNNANSSLFTIKSSLNGAFKIKIFSADGKLVDQQNSLDSLFTYNYNSLKNGAYFVTVQNNSNTNTFKFEVSK